MRRRGRKKGLNWKVERTWIALESPPFQCLNINQRGCQHGWHRWGNRLGYLTLHFCLRLQRFYSTSKSGGKLHCRRLREERDLPLFCRKMGLQHACHVWGCTFWNALRFRVGKRQMSFIGRNLGDFHLSMNKFLDWKQPIYFPSLIFALDLLRDSC